MKKLLLFLVTVLLLTSFVNTKAQPVNDWNWAYPKPLGITLQWCKMFDANTMYAAGYYGGFAKTTNGGTTWTYVASNVNSFTGAEVYVYGGWFLNMNTGFLCGSSGTIVKTTDGGVTWDSVAPGPTSTNYDMYFINNNTGFCSGSTTRDISKTTDGGATWEDISGNIAGSSKYCVYAWDANNIIVGTSSGDTYKTTNGGTNWTMHDIGYSATIRKINFIDANTGFCSGSSGTVRLTTNGGVNWTGVNPGPTGYMYDIDFGPSTVATPKLFQNFEATTWPPTGWTNTGTTTIWSRSTAASGYGTGLASARAYFYGISSGTGILQTLTFTATSAGESLMFDHAYANYSSPANDSLRILSSTNGGSTWTILSKVRCGDSLQTAPNTSGNFVPTAAQWGTKTYVLPTGTNRLRFYGYTDYGNNLYLDNIQVGASGTVTPVYVTGDPFYIYKSMDLGSTWDTLGFLSPTQPITSTYYSTSLSTTGDTIFTVGAYGMMNKRFSASNTVCYRQDWNWWTSTNNAVEVFDNIIMIPSSYSSILRSTNLGSTWDTSKVNYSYSGTLYSISKVNNTTAWVGGSGGHTYYTTDAGASWTESTNNTTSTIYNVNFVNANTGWLFATGATGGIEKTTDGGTTWVNQTATGVTSTIYGSCMLDANTGWLVGNSGKVSMTTDGGTTWTAQTSNYSSTLRNIDMINANTGWMVGYSATVRGTTDGGTTWDTVSLPHTYPSLYAVDFVDEWNGMVVGAYGVTYRTRDAGATWVFENTGTYSHYGVKMMTTDSGFIASSSGYVLKYAEKLTGGNTYTHEVPVNYELSQNYPNPFNPMTTIQFGLPKAGRVSLKIYDVSGRLVRTLVNNEGLNEGTFKYTFNGSDIASGVYFYSLIVNGDLINTKKMVLVK